MIQALKGNKKALAIIASAAAGLCAITWKQYRSLSAPSTDNVFEKTSPALAGAQAATLKSHVESNPEDFNAWARLGIAYFHKGPDDYPLGLNALEKARALGAVSEALFYYAGVMYDELGLLDYAINELEKFNRHRPGLFEVQVRLANLYLRRKDLDKAESLYRDLLRRDSKDPTLWFNYAMVQKERSDGPGALASLEKVRQLAGQLPPEGLLQESEIRKKLPQPPK